MNIYRQYFFWGSSTIILTFVFTYLIQALIYYKIAEKAGLDNKWIAFIPILQFVIFFHVIDRSALYILFGLISFIPIVGPLVLFVLGVYWKVMFYRTFGLDNLLIILAVVIPFVDFIVELYIAFSDSVQYQDTNRFQVYK